MHTCWALSHANSLCITLVSEDPVLHLLVANLRQAFATESTKVWKVLFRATKSVSQFTSTMVAMFLFTATPTRPCAVGRP